MVTDSEVSPTEDGGRRVVACSFVTLDGYMVGPDEDISWVIAGFDREMQADIAEDMSRNSDVFVFGRVTYVLAATVRVTRDLDAAEEAVQDAYVPALRAWARDGVPDRPGAWLTTVARRAAGNVIRRRRTLETKLPLLLEREDTELSDPDPDTIPDDRLRLIFTCCHPALAREAQVALTLRLVCGVGIWPSPVVALNRAVAHQVHAP